MLQRTATVRPVQTNPTDPAVRPDRPDRKTDILLAAEKLFASHGYHAVSIRQIALEAGVPLALVGYYYGPKQDLFHAIFARWSVTIDERLSALAAAQQQPGPNMLERIVQAFIGPVLAMRASAEGEYYALLVARELMHANAEADRVLRGYFDPLAHAFIDALHAALPQASRADVAWGYQFALGALLHHICDLRVARLSKGINPPGDAAAAPFLARFIAGGLRAALGQPASRRLKAADAKVAPSKPVKPLAAKPAGRKASPTQSSNLKSKMPKSINLKPTSGKPTSRRPA